MVIWLTGLSGSGKTTIANKLAKHLKNDGIFSFILDGDIVREGLSSDLGFSTEDRSENIRRIIEVAKLLIKSGTIVIVAAITPFKIDRAKARETFKDAFIEVYVYASIEECIKRDPKGLYEKAKSGKIKKFTGISSKYEIPDTNEIIVNTEVDPSDVCALNIYNFYKTNEIIKS